MLLKGCSKRKSDPLATAGGTDRYCPRDSKLNAHLPSTDADYNEMIRAFLVSAEYRGRLGL
ncbi:MAG: hypothetical protein ACJ74T_09300 [Pyrinomonadaceae bacterium]